MMKRDFIIVTLFLISIKAYQSLPRFGNNSFLAWLYRIAANASYDELRGRKKNQVLSFKEEPAGSWSSTIALSIGKK